MNTIKNANFRIKIAWVCWFVLFIFVGIFISLLSVFIIFYCIGGLPLVSDIWHEKAKGNYLWVILAPIAPAFHLGNKFGTKLWEILILKSSLISDEQARKMMGK